MSRQVHDLLLERNSLSQHFECWLGVFIETLETNEVRIERRFFASQEYTELLLAHVELTRLAPRGWISQAIDQQWALLLLRLGRKINVPVEVNEKVTSVDIDLTIETRNDEYV